MGYDRGFKEFKWFLGQGRGERVRINSQRIHQEDFCAPKTMIAADKYLQYYYKEKLFLYVDTWDPHEPWNPPPWYVELYYPGYDGREVMPCYGYWQEINLKKDDVELAHACYCGEITMVDLWFGRLLDRIESLRLMENTVIVFTADHGFYFGEHGYFGKARRKDTKLSRNWYRSPLYEEIARVPLLVYVPGVKPRKTKAMVSLVDLMPTLLELAEVGVPENIDGQSFLSVLETKKNDFRDIVVTSWPLYNPGEKTEVIDLFSRRIKEPQPTTITTDKWSLLYSRKDCPVELYDLEHDPNQSKNIFEENRTVVKDLHRKFVELLEKAGTDKRNLDPRRELGTF